MCGIFCSLSRRAYLPPSDVMRERLEARGPDASVELRELSTGAQRPTSNTYMTFMSTVLSLRGPTTIVQPFRPHEQGSILCWNGEAWSLSGVPILCNDTALVHALLCKAADVASNLGGGQTDQDRPMRRAISSIAGPFAFVFYDHSASRLWFGRDFLGRRSLLYHVTNAGDIILSSVADETLGTTWMEVEADGIYCINFVVESSAMLSNLPPVSGDFTIHKYPYYNCRDNDADIQSAIPRLSLNRVIPAPPAHLGDLSPSVNRIEELLRTSVLLRVQNIPYLPQVIQSTIESSTTPAKLGILFSGGLDCTVLARLAHDYLPISEPIDLLNVAFENPRVHKSLDGDGYEYCPDRKTGRASHAELCRICPDRIWHFVAIDVPYVETQAHRHKVVALMHPHNTEMDLSIAYALYFAARGSGTASPSPTSDLVAYSTSARVLLSGLGADELFAGYTRHATAFHRRGFDGLLDELELDLGRLGKRNLGRDDRVISHWAKEARFPFLDECLVAWAVSASVTEKCGFGIELGAEQHIAANGFEAGKMVLRCLASRLGLEQAAREKKRAIQFGARTAKMESGKSQGTQVIT